MCLGVRVLLVMRGEVIGCAAEARHRWRHFDSLWLCWSRKVEGGERFSWAQRDARVGERLVSDLQDVQCNSGREKSCSICFSFVEVAQFRLFSMLEMAGLDFISSSG